MYTMKDACHQLGITYETLKFYCKEGLVPNVKRDKNNYRLFDDKNIAWINGLLALRKCGMSIKDIRLYMNYCLQGASTILERKKMLDETRDQLVKKMQEITESLDYINDKQNFYDGILSGEIEYTSNLINDDSE